MVAGGRDSGSKLKLASPDFAAPEELIKTQVIGSQATNSQGSTNGMIIAQNSPGIHTGIP